MHRGSLSFQHSKFQNKNKSKVIRVELELSICSEESVIRRVWTSAQTSSLLNGPSSVHHMIYSWCYQQVGDFFTWSWLKQRLMLNRNVSFLLLSGAEGILSHHSIRTKPFELIYTDCTKHCFNPPVKTDQVKSFLCEERLSITDKLQKCC